MKLHILGIAVLAVGLSGCSKDKDDPKNCTEQFIDAYNSLVYQAQALDENSSSYEIGELADGCYSFKSTFGNQSCRAENTETGELMTIDTTKMDCAAIQREADNS